MITPNGFAATYRFGDRDVRRMGYGAMQLAGPGVFGPPRDRDEAIAVLREAVASGIDHIDTSDYYGPFVTNDLIREALHPYPEDLALVTKVGAVRSDDAGWHPAQSPAELVSAVHDNLRRLRLDQLYAVNLRRMDDHGSSDPIEPQLEGARQASAGWAGAPYRAQQRWRRDDRSCACGHRHCLRPERI